MAEGARSKKKERKLEEFRSFRTSKRRKRRKQRSDGKRKQNSKLFYVCEKLKNSSEKPSNQVVIEN